MIAIIDYGVGNLNSVYKAVENLKGKPILTSNFKDLKKADKVILPGVGAFKEAMSLIKKIGLNKAISDFIDSGKPFLGICLGLQLVFPNSYEGGFCRGFGVIDGIVKKFHFSNLKIPHMGWNSLEIKKSDILLKGIIEIGRAHV